MNQTKKQNITTFLFEHKYHIMFFAYNFGHPTTKTNMTFELGRVRIISSINKLYTCKLMSNPHLNSILDWNQDYFFKLFQGLSTFELEGTGDQHDDTMTLLVRDPSVEDQRYLLRAKLVEEFCQDIISEIWTCFNRYNNQKIKTLEVGVKNNQDLRVQADNELSKLMNLQQTKQNEKRKLKSQLSALLKQKEAKLRQFNQNFDYFSFSKQSQASQIDPKESIAGSLFQQSQDFHYPF